MDFLILGGVKYNMLALLAFFDECNQDAATRLAGHLVATKLNLAMGSDPAIVPTVEAADAFLAIYPPGSNPKGAARDQANAIKDQLDAYNNDEACFELGPEDPQRPCAANAALGSQGHSPPPAAPPATVAPARRAAPVDLTS